MRISALNKSPLSFGALYKTEDVLRLVTGYPYKGKATDGKLINSLTGVNIYSKEFSGNLPKDTVYLFAILSIHDACSEEIIRQHPELEEVFDTYDCQRHLKEGKKAQDNWFKTQLIKFKPEIDIESFKLDRKKLENTYKNIETTFNQIF